MRMVQFLKFIPSRGFALFECRKKNLMQIFLAQRTHPLTEQIIKNTDPHMACEGRPHTRGRRLGASQFRAADPRLELPASDVVLELPDTPAKTQ